MASNSIKFHQSSKLCRLAFLGQHVGRRVSDVHVLREKGFKREIKLIRMLMFITSNLWKVRFGPHSNHFDIYGLSQLKIAGYIVMYNTVCPERQSALN